VVVVDIGIALIGTFLLALWLVKTKSLRQKKTILLVSYLVVIACIFVEPGWLSENMSNIHGAALFLFGILAFLVFLVIAVMERPQKQYMHATLLIALVVLVYQWLVDPPLQQTFLLEVLQFAPLAVGVLAKKAGEG